MLATAQWTRPGFNNHGCNREPENGVTEYFDLAYLLSFHSSSDHSQYPFVRKSNCTMLPVRKATLIVSVVLPVVAIVTICLRFYARRARKLPLLSDDWSILFALVSLCFISGAWTLIRPALYGCRKHPHLLW